MQSIRNQIEPIDACAYIDTKKRNTVPMIAAIGDVSHFLNDAAIGEDVPLKKKQTKCYSISNQCSYICIWMH